MEDFILSETKKIFNKAIKRFAKNDSKEQENVSILLRLNGEREVEYVLCHDHSPHRETTIKEILDVRTIDMKGYTLLVPPQIKNIIEKLEAQESSKNIEVCVYLNREEDDEIHYFLYQDGNFKKEVFLLELIK